MSASRSDVERWLIEWFRNTRPGIEPTPRANYFDTGLIDSFGVIMMIAEIEETFGMQFDENNFQERRFVTIEGLAAIVSELATRS